MAVATAATCSRGGLTARRNASSVRPESRRSAGTGPESSERVERALQIGGSSLPALDLAAAGRRDSRGLHENDVVRHGVELIDDHAERVLQRRGHFVAGSRLASDLV